MREHFSLPSSLNSEVVKAIQQNLSMARENGRAMAKIKLIPEKVRTSFNKHDDGKRCTDC